MAEIHFDKDKTAVLTLDIQKGIFGFLPEAETTVVPKAAQVVNAARKKGIRVIHVGLGFEPGHPEIGQVTSNFSMVKKNNVFVKGSESAQFHPSVFLEGDMVIYKQRVGGFSDNTLEMVLRSNGIQHLVLMGISTSGIVLSTLRRAYDLDFASTVIEDACADRDEEVHRVLAKKVFAAQAKVLTAAEFEKALEA
jgi:nicotinamidase-related amidase